MTKGSKDLSTPGRTPRIAQALLLGMPPAFAAGLIALVVPLGLTPTARSWLVGGIFATTLVLILAKYVLMEAINDSTMAHRDPAPTGPKSELILLLLAAVALSILITYPSLGDIGTRILGNTGDAGLNIYLMEWQLHALATDPAVYFSPNIFAPERHVLVWGPVLAPLVPMYAAGKFITGNPIAAFNLLMVAVSFATLLATYFFLRHAAFGRVASGLGALLYATTGQRMAHLGHLDSFQTLWIPIFSLLLLKIWKNGRLHHGLLLGLALGLSLLTAPYYFLSGLALVGAMILIQLMSPMSIPWKSLAGAAAAALMIGAPILAMSRLADLNRSMDEIVPTSWADFYHPGALTPTMRWLAATAGASGGGLTLENWLFPSLAMTVLGAIGALRWLQSTSKGICPLPAGHPDGFKQLLTAAGISGIVMAAGTGLSIGDVSVPLPMLALTKLPGFESARVTGRFVVPAFLALTVLSLVGLESLTAGMRRRAHTIAMVAVAALTLATTQVVYPSTPLDLSGKPADVNRALAKLPPGLVVELPWPDCPGYGCLFTEPPRMIWSRFDWLPRLGGYSGHTPPYWPDAQESLGSFPDGRSMGFLREYEARYVILRVSAGDQGAAFTADQAAELALQSVQHHGVMEALRFGDDYLLILD